MANVILKHQVATGLAPSLESIKRGEIAINLFDGDIYYRKVTDVAKQESDVVTKLDIAGALSRLADVALSGLADGHALIYSASEGKWKNVKLSTANISNFAEAVDAAITAAVGTTVQAHSENLDKLAALEGTGFVSRTADGTVAARTITSTSLVVTNGDGVAANPTIELKPNGVGAGTFGSTTAIPVVTVDANGLVTNVSEEAISTSLNVAAGTGEATIDLSKDKLTVTGAGVISTKMSEKAVTIELDDSGFVKTTEAQSVAGVKTFSDMPVVTADQGDVKAGEANEVAKLGTLRTQTIYTDANPNGATVAIGGIAKGKKYENANVLDVLNDLLHPYVKPTNVRLSLNVAGGVFEMGSKKNITSGTVSWTAGSQPITKAEILENSEVVGSANVSAGTSASVTLTEAQDVGTNISFTPRVTDATGTTTGSAVSFTFVYPFYHGVINSDVEVNEASVKALMKDVSTKGSKSYKYDTAGVTKKCVIAYPASYGNLRSVLDPNKFENIDKFAGGLKEVKITGLDSTAQNYKVYVAATNVSNMQFTFSF